MEEKYTPCTQKGRYLNDVRKIFVDFGPPPFCHAFTQPISSVCHALGNPPCPPQCGRHLSIAPKHFSKHLLSARSSIADLGLAFWVVTYHLPQMWRRVSQF